MGFRIKMSIDRALPEHIRLFEGIPASIVSDAMGRHGALAPRVRAVHRSGRALLGSALTVRVRSADNLMAHKAIDMALPGDIILIEVGGDEASAIMGEIMCKYAQKRGVAGIVIDGLIRDTDALREMDFPVYSVGSSPLGPWKDGPGEIGFPIVCGGVLVNPGDIAVGDSDGVVIVPKAAAREIARVSREIVSGEDATFEQIEAGTLDRAWVDKTLRDRGCEFVE